MENNLLQDIVAIVAKVNSLQLHYIHPRLESSRSQGGGRVSLFFLPERPQQYTVCNTVYCLTNDLHNRLCLLRGVLLELLPKTEFLGNCLSEVVRASMFFVLCSFPLWDFFL